MPRPPRSTLFPYTTLFRSRLATSPESMSEFSRSHVAGVSEREQRRVQARREQGRLLLVRARGVAEPRTRRHPRRRLRPHPRAVVEGAQARRLVAELDERLWPCHREPPRDASLRRSARARARRRRTRAQRVISEVWRTREPATMGA